MRGGRHPPKVRANWFIAPNVPLYSMGAISLIYFAETTENDPNAMPQISRPMLRMYMFWPIIEMPTPMRRIKLRM
jgi:hypothetical protein